MLEQHEKIFKQKVQSPSDLWFLVEQTTNPQVKKRHCWAFGNVLAVSFIYCFQLASFHDVFIKKRKRNIVTTFAPKIHISEDQSDQNSETVNDFHYPVLKCIQYIYEPHLNSCSIIKIWHQEVESFPLVQEFFLDNWLALQISSD